MNKSESNGRIRLVAIVLSSVDATTARQLLGQLPASQARLVRQQMATLGNVSPAERESASKMLAQLTTRTSSASSASNGTASQPRNSSQSSPAEALLSNVSNGIDRVELTHAFTTPVDRIADSQPHDSSSLPVEYFEDRYIPIQGRGENPFQSPQWIPTWQQWSGDELARLLMNERPTLIAAVLMQAPAELGSTILQSLPSSIATSVLSALPQLHTTDASVLQEIYSQLHQKLADFQRQSSPENAGLAKLQSILAVAPREARTRFEQGLASAQPLLAHALGMKNSQSEERTPAPTTQAPFSEPIVALQVYGRREADLQAALSLSTNTPGADAGLDANERFHSFENLSTLSLEDFAIVLRSVDPQTILLAACGASHEMQKRIEALIDPKEIKRLRLRLQSLKAARAIEKQSAQGKIAQAAHILFQQGRIARLSDLTELAAA